MKLLLYIVVGFVAMAIAVLVITRGQALETNPAILFGLLILFGIPPMGAFWMAYMAIRYEKNPFPMLLLAFFVPFTFLWYYFERVRPGKLKRARNVA